MQLQCSSFLWTIIGLKESIYVYTTKIFETSHYTAYSSICVKPSVKNRLFSGLLLNLVSWYQIDRPTLLQIPLKGILRCRPGSWATRAKCDFFFDEKKKFLILAPILKFSYILVKRLMANFQSQPHRTKIEDFFSTKNNNSDEISCFKIMFKAYFMIGHDATSNI